MRLSREGRFGSVEGPRSCKKGAAFGFYGRVSRVLLLGCDAGWSGVRRLGVWAYALCGRCCEAALTILC